MLPGLLSQVSRVSWPEGRFLGSGLHLTLHGCLPTSWTRQSSHSEMLSSRAEVVWLGFVCSLSLCDEFLHQGLPCPTASPPTGLSASALLGLPSIRSLNSSCLVSPHWRMASRSESLDQAVCEHSTEMNHVYLKLIRSRATHLSLAESTHLQGLHTENSRSSRHRDTQISNTSLTLDASLPPSA